jgi:AraC-like DNA-binding protein
MPPKNRYLQMLKHFALLSPIFITFFWSLVFFIQFGKKDKPKLHLGIFMVVSFLLYCSHAIFFSKQYHLYSYVEGFYIFSMLSLYPLYYNYLLMLTIEKINLKRKFYRLLPAIVFGILALTMTLILSEQERILYVKDTLIGKNLRGINFSSLTGIKGIIFFMSRVFFLFQVVFFGIKGIQLAKNHNKKIADYYSNMEGKTLNWVGIISVIIIVAAIASITFTFVGRSYFSKNEVSLLVPSVIFSSFLFIIGFKGNHQTQINTDYIPEIKVEKNDDINGKQTELRAQLLYLFEVQKIYKNIDLRIVLVAEKLNTNRTYISNFINEDFQMNFSDFVNKYRVQEAKELMRGIDQKSYTLEYIAEKSGFGSVHSFTRVFKVMEGMPPGKYRSKSNRF